MIRFIMHSSMTIPCNSSYINRHIEVDSSGHGPLSLELFNFTCNNDQKIFDEAISFAIKAIESRINLWDGVYKKIRDLD